MRNFAAGYTPEDGTTFAELIESLRTQRNWSQAQLATRADIDRTTISRIESGVRYPSYSMVIRIADALRVDAAMRARMIVEAFVPIHYREDVRDVLNAMHPEEVAS